MAAMFVDGSGQNEQFLERTYQVSLHLAERFQRRRLKCEKLTDDRRRTPSDDKSSPCLWQGELKKMGFFIFYLKRKHVLKLQLPCRNKKQTDYRYQLTAMSMQIFSNLTIYIKYL